MNLEFYGTAIAGATFFYWMIRNFKKDIEARFNKVDGDLTDIKERLSFLEAANIYTMPLEQSQPNPRSQAAKAMWNRRKQKKVEAQQ